MKVESPEERTDQTQEVANNDVLGSDINFLSALIQVDYRRTQECHNRCPDFDPRYRLAPDDSVYDDKAST